MKSLDVQKALEIHRSTCESMGLLDSCLALGNMYYVGQGESVFLLQLNTCTCMLGQWVAHKLLLLYMYMKGSVSIFKADFILPTICLLHILL